MNQIDVENLFEIGRRKIINETKIGRLKELCQFEAIAVQLRDVCNQELI